MRKIETNGKWFRVVLEYTYRDWNEFSGFFGDYVTYTSRKVEGIFDALEDARMALELAEAQQSQAPGWEEVK